MSPVRRIAIALTVTTGVLIAAGLRWQDPEPAVYEAATGNFTSLDVAVASSPSLCGTGAAHFKDFPPSLVDAFQKANAAGASPGNVSVLSKHFAIASSTQLAALEAQGLAPQRAGSQRIPILRLSRVGFNTDQSEALMCVRAPHGSMLIHLRKLDGRWQVDGQEEMQVATLMGCRHLSTWTATSSCNAKSRTLSSHA